MYGFYLHHISRLGGNIISSYHFQWLAELSIYGLFSLMITSLPVKEATHVFN